MDNVNQNRRDVHSAKENAYRWLIYKITREKTVTKDKMSSVNKITDDITFSVYNVLYCL